jgi:predicted ribosomally synthesized peptide with SipW-like signal peptide
MIKNKALAPRRAMQVKALLSMGVLVGLGAVSTLAAWTGSATATSTISAGTISLGAGATSGSVQASYPVLTGTNWYPGMSQAAVVVVKNTGSLAAPYSIAGSVAETGAGALGNGLNVVVTNGAVSGTSPLATCTPGTFQMTKAAGAAFPAAVARPSLAPGASETLCVQYTLPTTAPSTLQAAATAVTLTFTATIGS